MAGISKVILAITKAQITPNLHLEKLNPNIDLGGFNTLMPDKLVEWKSASLRSGVSSFGSSGIKTYIYICICICICIYIYI